MTQPTVVVFGSINADTSLYVDTLPAPGETLHARSIRRDSGGKGANQACAAAHAGARTVMIGCVGDDDGGAVSRQALVDAGVDDAGISVVDRPTGSATITVDAVKAENTIVIDAGANAAMDVERASAVAGTLADAAAVILQLEIPLDAVIAAARAATGTVVLNAAPAAELPKELLELVDVLVVNETELDIVSAPFLAQAGTHQERARSIEGPKTVVVTTGSAGAMVLTAGAEAELVPAPSVTPVDTTGAGDCFVGTFVAHCVAGTPMAEAARLAVEVASRSTLFEGARGYLRAP